MNRRMLCILLSAVLLLCLIPVGAVPASAASSHTYSEKAVSMIKELEGFSSAAFWDVSQWSIGYGTVGYEGQTMTKEEADRALRDVLTNLDEEINDFARENGLSFTQAQHDALLSFSFNVGSGWMNTPGRFRSAVISGKKGNEFLFAISLWGNVESVPNAGILNRRLAEANLYLNGVYAKNRPSNYTYVIFNSNGGTHGSGGEDKEQGYDLNLGAKILAADAEMYGRDFGGWYTSATGGNAVTTLNASTAGKILYAQYGVKVEVTGTYVNVRSGAGTGYTKLGTRSRGDTMVIVQTTTVNNVLWGRFSGGWVDLEYTNYDRVGDGEFGEPEEPIASGRIVCDTYVNVRRGPGTGYAVAGMLANGTEISIYEYVTTDGDRWGRVDSGWVSMEFVSLGDDDYAAPAPSEDDNDSYTEATVTGSAVNVRAAAGVGNRVVTILNKGARVKVYEQVTKDNVPWGKIAQGWICMNYVLLDSDNGLDTGVDDEEEPIAEGTVSSNTGLNVRSGAGINYNKVGMLPSGTRVLVYEKVTVSGMTWGRIGKGRWVSLSYVKLEDEPVEEEEPPVQDDDEPIAYGTVSSNTALNVRSGAGTGYTRLRSLNPGTRISVYETVTINGQRWGRIDAQGWVCLSYVRMDTDESGIGTGRVISTSGLRIRSAAGTGSAIVGSLTYRAEVTIYEQVTVGSTDWGRMDRGWVCMDYIEMLSELD